MDPGEEDNHDSNLQKKNHQNTLQRKWDSKRYKKIDKINPPGKPDEEGK